MNLKLIVCALFIALLYSCNPASPNAPNNGSKLISNWIEGKYLFIDEGAGLYFEEWKKIDSTTYNGSGFYLTNDFIDTLFSMRMQLLLQPKKTIMIYDIKEDGELKKFEFVLTNKELSTYVFENPFRDFPSIMQYKFLSDSTIEVTERGFVDNKEKVREYTIKKIN